MLKNVRLVSTILIAMLFTSCELLVDYSGIYSGSVDVTMTVMGNTTTTPTALSVEVTKVDGTYYLDGIPLEGVGSSLSYTQTDSGVDYIVDLEFSTTTLSLSYGYEIDLGGGMLYEYDISGTLEKQ